MGLRPQGRRQEGVQVDQKKESVQRLEKPGWLEARAHGGEKMEEVARGGGQAALTVEEAPRGSPWLWQPGRMVKGEMSSHVPHLLLLGQPWTSRPPWSFWKRWSQRCSRRQRPPWPSW